METFASEEWIYFCNYPWLARAEKTKDLRHELDSHSTRKLAHKWRLYACWDKNTSETRGMSSLRLWLRFGAPQTGIYF